MGEGLLMDDPDDDEEEEFEFEELDPRAIAEANRKFEMFHGRTAKEGEIIAFQEVINEVTFAVGRLHGISYMVEDEDKPLFHQFSLADPPLLVVSADGKQAYILQGEYTFNSRGFKK